MSVPGTASSEPDDEPCVLCEMNPGETEPVETSNRAVFNVGAKYSIKPICEEHDTRDVETEVKKAYENSGIALVAAAVARNAVERELAFEHIPASKHQDLRSALQSL